MDSRLHLVRTDFITIFLLTSCVVNNNSAIIFIVSAHTSLHLSLLFSSKQITICSWTVATESIINVMLPPSFQIEQFKENHTTQAVLHSQQYLMQSEAVVVFSLISEWENNEVVLHSINNFLESWTLLQSRDVYQGGWWHHDTNIAMESTPEPETWSPSHSVHMTQDNYQRERGGQQLCVPPPRQLWRHHSHALSRHLLLSPITSLSPISDQLQRWVDRHNISANIEQANKVCNQGIIYQSNILLFNGPRRHESVKYKTRLGSCLNISIIGSSTGYQFIVQIQSVTLFEDKTTTMCKWMRILKLHCKTKLLIVPLKQDTKRRKLNFVLCFPHRSCKSGIIFWSLYYWAINLRYTRGFVDFRTRAKWSWYFNPKINCTGRNFEEKIFVFLKPTAKI